MPELLSARKLRKANDIDVDLGDGSFIKCRREDMTLLVFEGRVPMPMLSAVQKMIEMPNASPMERIQALGPDHGRTLVEVLREHACKVSLDPKIVMDDDGNEDHLPVVFLDTHKLMTIWQATALIPGVSTLAAATFREGRSANPDLPVPNGTVLPQITQHVDTPTVEFISG